MELFDIVDKNGTPTGEIVERTIAHEKGIRHRTAHIWVTRIENRKVQVLLQKRAQNKDSFPGRFDTSSAGHIQAGDEPLDSAIRELSEELGIYAKKDDLTFVNTFDIKFEKEFHGKLFKDDEIAFVYLYEKPVKESSLSLQTEEVECVEWFDLTYVYEECKKHNQTFCVPVAGLEIVKTYYNL